MKSARFIIGTLAGLIAAAPLVRSAQSGNRPPPQPRTYKVTVSPAAVPDEPLKYRFVVDPIDQVEGNSAPIYMRAVIMRQQIKDVEKDDDLFSDYLSEPIDSPKRKAVAEALPKYRSMIDQVELGSVRSSCRWEQSVSTQGINALLPELNWARSLIRVLAVQARIQIFDKQYDQAIRTLRVGFALSEHLDTQPVLIQSLVSAGCYAQMLSIARDLSEQPDAPNLYWAISSLPRPFVDQRQTMLWEKNFLYFSFPQLKSAARNSVSAAEWQKLWADLNALNGVNQPESAQLLFMSAAFRDYGRAKAYLLSTGLPAEQVEKMPVVQAVGMYFVHVYEKVGGGMWKWWLLPYAQARQGMARTEDELRKARAEDPLNPIFLLLPAVNAAYTRFAWIDRDSAATQCVEALRAYAAAHDGQLPETLEALTDTPAPLDPTTGKPFIYRVNGKTATLESLPTGSSPTDGMKYEITIR